MASKKTSNGLQRKNNNWNYLKALVEGMQDWLEIKEMSGNQDIPLHRAEIENEIETHMKNTSGELTKVISVKMKSLGCDKSLVSEFRSVFR
ncbi:hypothetical protein J4205_03490 [Candidatus Pacearchaeota archaeon]|nr:hypothetical protein [Candidatus Pacearchaeota archaeon]